MLSRIREESTTQMVTAGRNIAALRKRGGTTVEAECCGKEFCCEQQQHEPPQLESHSWRTFVLRHTVLLLLLFLVTLLYVSRNGRSPESTMVALSQPRRRFPKYGTEEFVRQCNWTVPSLDDDHNPSCSILARPHVRSSEGIANWASQITRAYMQARQVGCKVVLDYGVDVDIAQVLTPFADDNHSIHNWTVPPDLVCDEKCQFSAMAHFGNWSFKRQPMAVPNYRHFFTFPSDFFYRGDFDYMPHVFPGFEIETGMACALGNLLRLSPAAAQFEPRLFDSLLPAVQDDGALVLALYMRTNRADVMAVHERRNESIEAEQVGKYDSAVDSYAKIAHCLEEQYLSGVAETGIDIARVYWVVLSDSPEAKRSVVKRFSGKDANARLAKEKRQWKSRVIPRTVLTTNSRGIHVRAERKPSTSEFAEAFLDWYLIGESDAVITDMQSSFGPTGAMRTNRPIYRIGKCEQLPLVHERSEKKMKEERSQRKPVARNLRK